MAKKQQQQQEQPQVRPGQQDMFGNLATGQTDITDLMYAIPPSGLQHKTKPPKRKRIRVLSPDGFDIRMDKTWLSPVEAANACLEWVKGFEFQGYYSTTRNGYRERIELADLPSECTFPHTDGSQLSMEDAKIICTILGIV